MGTPEDARRLRQDLRWSQQRLANASGVNKAYISEWENGIRELQAADSRKIWRALEAGDPVELRVQRLEQRVGALERRAGMPLEDE